MISVKCYYEVLRIEQTASAEDIRKSYLKLAREWHPDKNTDKDDENKVIAEETFKEIQNAYDTLKTPSKREWYVGAVY